MDGTAKFQPVGIANFQITRYLKARNNTE